jgi:hypothetical protein
VQLFTQRLWLFHPNNSWFVTSPSPGYASRPNRAIDDRGLSPHKIRSLVGCSPNGPRISPVPRGTGLEARDRATCTQSCNAASHPRTLSIILNMACNRHILPGRCSGYPPHPPQNRTCRIPASGSSVAIGLPGPLGTHCSPVAYQRLCDNLWRTTLLPCRLTQIAWMILGLGSGKVVHNFSDLSHVILPL